MKKILATVAALTLTMGAAAQGNNTGMGGSHDGYTSLAERVLKLEKKSDAFNVYLNYAASFQASDESSEWTSSFKNKQARIEFAGNITPKLSYRFRHRLHRARTTLPRRPTCSAWGISSTVRSEYRQVSCARTGEDSSMTRIRCTSISSAT